MNMESPSDNLVPVFMPALVAMLVHEEDKKGAPLTLEEVLAFRDNAACIMMEADDARTMDDSRGYRDIDPENCWHDWQMNRRAMNRKPDLDPGPRFGSIKSSDPAYQQTIRDAHASISRFREVLPSDGSPRANALIKTKLFDGENSALMWLNNTAINGENYSAVLFEVPDTLPGFKIGERHIVSMDNLLDWMVNENGRLFGGYSLRYHRARLSDKEKLEYDDYIGVSEYA